MAIGFGKLEFVTRLKTIDVVSKSGELIQKSVRRNIVCKAAYLERGELKFEGTSFQEPESYSFSHLEKSVYNKVYLPSHVDERFYNTEILWNAVEKFEKRKDSQVGMDFVLALPDDPEISLEDKIILAERLLKSHFVSKGYGVQMAIHAPHRRGIFSETGELEEVDHNWHCHLLMTPRTFNETGNNFSPIKLREVVVPSLRGKAHHAIEATRWDKVWTKIQNDFFEEKGLELRVDFAGIETQKHLGPVRMRGSKIYSELEKHDQKIALNQMLSREPTNILEKLTENKNIFTTDELEQFLQKHVKGEEIHEVTEAFWKQEQITPLFDKETFLASGKFSTKEIIKEENEIKSLADKIHARKALNLNAEKIIQKFTTSLTPEQKLAFKNIINGNRLSIIEGHAGTGKSHLLVALKNAYESKGYTVRGFGPDNSTVNVLISKGIISSENVHRFLYSIKNTPKKKNSIQLDNNEVWIIDESSKLGNKPLTELLKVAVKHKAQVIFSGNSAQLDSVNRGGMFTTFSKIYGAETLKDIQRQKDPEQLKITTTMARGEMARAVDLIQVNGGFRWLESKQKAYEELIKGWALGREKGGSSLIIACKNEDVDALNDLAHNYRKVKGELGEEFLCQTSYGKLSISVGDKIQFKRNESQLNINNGSTGILVEATAKKFVVLLEDAKNQNRISFDPREYTHFKLGYATTFFGSQGSTIDRAYVYFTKQLNKISFYVGMTRHVQEAYIFVPEEEGKNLSSLKWAVERNSQKETTLDYLTQEMINQGEQKKLKNEQIQNLVASDKLTDRLKGYTLSAWDQVTTKVHDTKAHYAALRPDQGFYSYTKSDNSVKIDIKEIVKTVIDINNGNPQPNSAKTNEHIKPWQHLQPAEKQIFEHYFDKIEEVGTIREIYETKFEAKRNNPLTSIEEICQTEYTMWLDACKQRDASAFAIKEKMEKSKIQLFLGKQAMNTLYDRALQHENLMKMEEQFKLDSLLTKHVEPLLTTLFSSQNIEKAENIITIGHEDTISLAAAGKKAGNYFEHKQGDNGGLFDLVKKTLGKEHCESVQWSKNFLKQQGCNFDAESEKVKKDWVSLKPTEELSLSPDQSLYPYRNAIGELLFYMTSYQDKNTKEKEIRPISFGYFKEDPSIEQWEKRGYLKIQKPLYNLPKIYQNPNAKILILEGESAVDQAAKLFPEKEITCVTWCRAPGSLKKTDWNALQGRDVIIWLSNDPASYGASEKIRKELRSASVNSIAVVDIESLRREFPKWWNFDAPLPKSLENIKRYIKDAEQKSIYIDQICKTFRFSQEEPQSLAQRRSNDILTAIEIRLKPQLRNPEELKKAILSDIALCKEKIDEDISENIPYQISSFIASTGKIPSKEKISQIHETFNALGDSKNLKQQILKYAKLDIEDSEKQAAICQYAFDKSSAQLIESVLLKGVSPDKAKNSIQWKARKIVEEICAQEKKEEYIQQHLSQSQKTTELNASITQEMDPKIPESPPSTPSNGSTNFTPHYRMIPFAKESDKDSLKKLIDQLKGNVTTILERLFPDGPKRRYRHECRVGSKGSLSVKCEGERAGYYYDFEKGEGGDILTLIEKTTGGTKADAIRWARNFVGEGELTSYQAKSRITDIADEWVSIKPKETAPELKAISPELSLKYEEAARYAYRNEKGDLLFYTLRLVEKNDKNSKMTPPLSFGYYKNSNNNPAWKLKGYQTLQKPMYNLDQLYRHPNATVLIVEGEKTADAATKLFSSQDIVTVTFSGGAGAVSKTDWQHLINRDVVIWPDNDKAGFKAANDLVLELRKQGVNSLKVVDPIILQKSFPEKWDLADEFPNGVKAHYLKDLMLRAHDKTLGLTPLLSQASLFYKDFDPKHPVNILLCREVLSRLEQRGWESLEGIWEGDTLEIKSAIQADALKLISKIGSTNKEMQTLGLRSDQSQTIAFGSVLFNAEHGREFEAGEMQKLKTASLQICQLAKQYAGSENEQTVVRLMAVSSYVNSGAMFSLKEDTKTFDKIRIQVQLQAASMSNFNELDFAVNGQPAKSMDKQIEIGM